ncbi:MAG: serine protein kinase PrkA [Pseudomonadota bacterium]
MKTARHTLTNLCNRIREKDQRTPISFSAFMDVSAERPDLVFRNIFQIFHDMILSHVGDGLDEYPDDPESIKFVYYDTNSLFVEGTDHPFFADRLFANRFVKHVGSLKWGAEQNRIYIFEGPHGCGKSTFLNNLLLKFEQYTRTEEGACYETLWRIKRSDLGALSENDMHVILAQLRHLADDTLPAPRRASKESLFNLPNTDILEAPCPSHDHPMLLIPKAYRKEVFDELIRDEEFKKRLFSDKQYEWIFRDNPCTICQSLYQTLSDLFDSPTEIFNMIFARRYSFNRRLGEGITVFNPGDRVTKNKVINNQLLQDQLNSLLKDSNRVRYLFSRYAKTNNGIYALMDIKDHNKERFANLHGIISEGVHKVEDIEENVNSLFLALMNPEDRENIADTQSFSDRIITIKIPYVLDYNTEVRIYKNIFGDQIETHFLPRVLQNFAKVIISTRLKDRSDGLSEWIADPEKYRLYCDKNLLLLKMDIYTGLIPPWLTDEDRKKFTARIRRRIIAESETEGDKGFSGRDALKIFNDLHSIYAKKDKLISMAMACRFFKKNRENPAWSIPEGFLDSLVSFYDYTVLQEVKESLYYFNEERISRDIQNYLFSVNFEIGSMETCTYTSEDLEITEVFLEGIERRILGSNLNHIQHQAFRKDIQNQYTCKALTQEMMVEGKAIHKTEIYQRLRERYVHNLKEKVMDPFLKNANFRSAIKDYATESFKTYDKRIKDEVTFLMKNLMTKFGYTAQGAKEVCIYVVDNDLAKTFAEKA